MFNFPSEFQSWIKTPVTHMMNSSQDLHKIFKTNAADCDPDDRWRLESVKVNFWSLQIWTWILHQMWWPEMLMFQVLDIYSRGRVLMLQNSHARHNRNRVCNVGIQAGQPLSAGSGGREKEFISLSLAADVWCGYWPLHSVVERNSWRYHHDLVTSCLESSYPSLDNHVTTQVMRTAW